MNMIASQKMTIIDWILNYADYVPYIVIVIIGLILYSVYYVKNKFFSNTSKLEKVNVRNLEQVPVTELIGIDEIRNGMYISEESNTYTGVIETDGIPFQTLPEYDRTAINSGYINFLSMINFPFSKHIISKPIDIEITDTIYANAFKRIETSLENFSSDLLSAEKEYEHKPSDEITQKIKRLKRKVNILLRDKEYTLEQIQYLKHTTSNIQGSSKSVYYTASASLDDEALKGLTPEQEIVAYEHNINDRLSAMISSLSNIGVKADKLNDVELLDLARTHYKPFSSSVYKTKHLLNETGVESDYSLNTEIFAKVRLHEMNKKEDAKHEHK
jgi:hypothetical protein